MDYIFGALLSAIGGLGVGNGLQQKREKQAPQSLSENASAVMEKTVK